ncbi:acid-activated periplasmic chaperone HdeB [Yersinia enterocolitica]|uniref:acid-activated periplasmic chaperone HdeB n=1 Tax=Yersinia enterocolitica TaxID=630 RepID=UPI001CA4C55D|nr:acid-activated periplasmic chaperone HdeB [Yersinia enterocolitica]MBW5835346.1 acid-activated periplasmic chaperone HdeB [Yersinia enterocolitica]MBX9489816.1 acid-activated periplasmic chaperone HdeB [Yersinia enterocolitica]MBX9494150.1 acid-activated periplasmic chaperone HdeB [Yersinia enterocolitica]HDL8054381.1 acid-activated periplasmic chaperone HdeB [Yersinia enterocolitica]HEN3623069.1 acid-activated periplasmic chaperone HdeB [Yersinia enterocolitica]
MSYKSLRNIALTGLLLSAAATSFAATTSATATTPSDMTCKEFLDLNPKSFTPVVYWVLNDDTQYKKGDYVDLHETDTIVTPKVVEVCKKSPESKLSEIKQDILGFAKKHM